MNKQTYDAAAAEAWVRERLGRTVHFPARFASAGLKAEWLDAVVVGWSSREITARATGKVTTIFGVAGAMAPGPTTESPAAEHRLLAPVPAGTVLHFISIEYLERFGRVEAAAVDSGRYPHACPRPGCGRPAYVGFNSVDCSSGHR